MDDNKNLILSAFEEVEYTYNSESDRIDIAGIACHWNKANLNAQIVTDRSFDTFLDYYNSGKLRPIVNYEHQYDKQIGLIDRIAKEADGLYIEGHLNCKIQYVNEWIRPLIESGDLKGLSTEGTVLNGHNGIIQREDGTYIVKDFILTAVAVTSTPADWNASLTVRNYIDEYAALQKPEEEIAKSRWYVFA